ncbi:hypothetical protein VINI7043_13581 [Vibrio nigripulchritudo ATCC 27043]|uniref:hypothetical protein n=1 Tax=Vibrio nigripulchritudo TaxID=28173 RepID=UPI00021C1145|nr:hypothetical protein [Vibrio nigripulchritudo]EGU59388.1 hypothetical protein VINI7043_13581 [Vibrio nigripulchritudo ATCC 27043]
MAENHQHIAGIVSANGEKVSGEGFTVTQDNTGEYIVTFKHPFAEQPAVVATLHNEHKDLSVHAVITYDITSNVAKILTGDADEGTGGTPKDSAFSFIAFGDRA